MSLEGNGASASNGHAVDHASNGNGNGEHAKSCTDASHHSNGHRNTIEWVACDRCNKWRSIPKDVHATLKPEDNWYVVFFVPAQRGKDPGRFHMSQ